MFSLDANASSLAPSALIFGLAFLVYSIARPDNPFVRPLGVIVTLALAWRYMAWRFAETIPRWDNPPDAIAGYLFASMEAMTVVASTVALFIISRTRERSAEATEHLAWWNTAHPPRVDILIATYNEEEGILERTIAGARASDYPNANVWVLDDGRRAWLRALCERLGAHYLTRADNKHAKAGNINAALAMLKQDPSPPDFIAVLDADFVPHRDFVRRALALFYEPTVGLVQTPQHFFNPDPIQHNLGIGKGYPDEQRYFFDHVQPARDAWSIAFCCGTSSMMRWTALQAIGGFPTDSVTEDFLITLRFREEGFSTVYLNESLTEGLAPEGLSEYITQRGRWCLGLMQIIRGPLGPLRRSRLRLIDRIGLIDAFLYWSTTYPFRLMCLFVPLLYWFFGLTAVNAPVGDVIYYFLPYYVSALALLNWISGGIVVPLLNDVSQLLGATEITKAVVIGIAKPKGHKFKVTTKGGDRTRVVVQWPIIQPLLIIFILTILGMLFSGMTDVVFERDPGEGRIVILFWSLYNLVVLAMTMAVCIEAPRSQLAPSIPPEPVRLRVGAHEVYGWMMRLTVDDAWIRGGPDVRPNDVVDLLIDGIGSVDATVLRVEASGSSLSLSPTPEQRAMILSKLHTRIGNAGTQRLNILAVAAGAMRRALRS